MPLAPETTASLLGLVLIGAGLALAAWRRFPWAYTLGLLSIAVFVVQLLQPALGSACALIRGGTVVRADCVSYELGFVVDRFFAGEQWWSPLTYMFVHGGLLHLAGNMFVLLTAGPRLEEKIGAKPFLLVYLASGVVAAFATLAVGYAGLVPEIVFSIPNVGASGAIFGILTMFAWLHPREPLPIPIGIAIGLIFWLPAYTVLIIHLGLNVVSIVSGDNVAWWGHLGGFFAGLVFAIVLPARLLPRARGRVEVEALRPLASTPQLRAALTEIERLGAPQTHDDPAFQNAWLDRFFSQAACPSCGGSIAWDGEVAESECGWRLSVRG